MTFFCLWKCNLSNSSSRSERWTSPPNPFYLQVGQSERKKCFVSPGALNSFRHRKHIIRYAGLGGLEHEFYDFPYTSWECHNPN